MIRRSFITLLAGVSSCQRRENETQWRGLLFGIEVSISFRGIQLEEAQEHGEKVFELARGLESSLSLWDEKSELRRLNREGKLAKPSAALLACLEKSRQLHQASQGLFDPSIHSFLEWAKAEYLAGRTPDKKETEKRRKLIDFSKVQFSKEEVSFPKGMALNLNAIVQGYVTDRVAELLEEQVSSALVNFGEYRVVGEKPWPVEVESEIIDLQESLAVSSGSGQLLSATSSANHLIHPDTGGSPPPRRIVAVQASEAWLADGLATIVALGGEIPSQYSQSTVRIWNS